MSVPLADELRTAAAKIRPDLAGESLDEFVARVILNVIAQPGDVALGELVRDCGALGALDAVNAGPKGDIATGRGSSFAQSLARWKPMLTSDLVLDAFRAARKASLTAILPGEENWPIGLDDLAVTTPLVLWVRGNADSLRLLRSSAALVGSSASTSYGEYVAEQFAAVLAKAPGVIVSTGDFGVASTVHRAALDSGATTVAFVSSGADRVYPQAHSVLFARIAERGAIVSEIAPGGTPTKWRALQRNRLVASATAATVVVEASWRSTSLNIAGHAAALNRPLGAVPGPITSAASEGANRLLREFDATCITDPSHVVELIDGGL